MAPRVHSSSLSSSMQCTADVTAPTTRNSATSDQREVFTIWMKSLVLNGSGCTVYDSSGRITHRVDNYGSRCTGNVYLMDLGGEILLKVLKKKLAFGKWEGYRFSGQEQEPRTWFTVRRPRSIFQAGSCPSCEFRSDTGHAMRYKFDERADVAKQACRIVDDATGLVVAEVKRKLTAGGVALGDDVLSLVVEPNVDHSLIMGLVLVYGLMHHIM